MENFGRMVPQRLSNINEELKRACQYQTFLAVGSEAPEDPDASGYGLSTDRAKDECALVVRCQTQKEGLTFLIDFDSAVLDRTQVVHVAHQLEHILRQMSTCGDQRQLRTIDVASPLDLRDIWLRNAVAPEPVLACVHDLIAAAARIRPDAPAVCAWDGELTHQQLDALSTRLAQQFVQLGIVRGASICLCFEKSVWTPVAILGVAKAGAVSVNLDISQPEDRLRAVVGQVAPRLILSSGDQSPLANRLGPSEVFTVGKELENLDPSTTKLPPVSPEDNLYIVFTSGSTGTPKGVMVTRGNFCSAIRHQKALGFRSTSRVYDFASYAFDVSWSNLLHTLAAGGCLCVPSDQDRKQDLAKSMRALGANYVDLTPTVAQLLSISETPQLKTLNLGGEALVPGTFDHWPDDIRIINAYGPAECTVVSTYTEVGRAKQDRGIGTALGTVAWVVDPDGNRLAAFGTVGELWIEGPLVARGYLDDVERTAQAFVRDPPWLLRGTAGYPGRHGRLYRTGDVVRYNPDGSLCYLGRADTQVKINGQRVELGDIEHHIRQALSAISPDFNGIVVAEVVHPLGSDHPVPLALFGPCNQAYESEAARHDDVDNAMLRRITSGLNERLDKVLPPHMIPSAYVSARDVSMTAATKVDRRRIRQTYASLEFGQIAGLGPASDERRRPQTWQQRQLQSLWARVLGIGTDRIGLDDNFFRMGGDSVGAMKLVGAAREQGLSLTVLDIFAHPGLQELAGLLVAKEGDDAQVSISPFSLLGAAVDIDGAVRKAASMCGTAPEQVQDMFRCTPLQEGLLAMTARRSGDYVARFIYKMPADVDLGCFVEAWTRITDNAPILRTRIVDLQDAGLFQVVTKGQLPWRSGDGVGEFLEKDKQQPMGLGTALTRLALVTSPSSGQVYFVWTIHHALYDGWSMPLMLKAVDGAYRGQSPPAWTPFQRFAQHVDGVDGQAAADFWRRQFEGSDAPQFPPLPSRDYHPAADSGLRHEIRGLEWGGSDFTASTLIRTALAIVIARHGAVDEAVFGATVSGRQAAVRGIDLVMGPTFATVPVRVPIDWAASVEDVLRKLQHQAMQMIPFEQLGLQTIRAISDYAERSCNFQTLLVVQPEEGKAADKTSLFCQPAQDAKSVIDAFATNSLVIECLLRNRGMHLRVSFDSAVVQQAEVERLAQQLEHLLRQLCCPESRRASIGGLDMLSDNDLETIWQWNGVLPAPVDSSVQQLLAKTFRQQPGMPAICAWDGELTYRELDVLSTRLARHLVKELRVGPEVVVPLLFEKSKWMPVSMLATIKAGGVSVAIDPSQPEHMSQRIVDEVEPRVILSSSSQELRAKRLGHGCKVVTVHDGLRAIATCNDDDTDLPNVGPDNRLYIVFTSGSTGTPKGATITHGNFCSAMTHQQLPLGYTSECRVFDFASYAFDAAWSNLLYTLFAGGCVCIPSELERKRDLAGSIRRLKATYLDLTPSVAELLAGSHVPLVNHVVLGGEGLTEAAYSHWPDHVRLTNTYGPAECTINSTSTPISPHEKHRRGIGTGIGTVTRVVANNGQLAPIGAIGELWLEGPIVGPGYFNMPTQTCASFVESPAWLLEGRRDGLSGRCGRLHKTGDLVRYNADGSLAFIGRKDTQVKIRGQRVELTAIEDYVRQLLHGEDSDQQDAFQGTLVAEVVTLRDRKQPMLVLFIHPGDAHVGTEQQNIEAVRRVAAPLAKRLAGSAPLYMLPSAFLPLQSVPKLSSEKVDRRQLRATISSVTWDEVAARNVLATSRGTRRAPESRQQRRMQTLWAQVLDLDAKSIGLDDNFLHLGGDSIKAMRLAAAAREEGILLHVADILRHPNLDGLTDCAKFDHDECEQDIAPFSLLGANVDEAAIRAHVASMCRNAQIYDMFPCTPLQAGLFALSMQQKGSYIARFVYELRPDVHVSRFTEAWDHAVNMSPILRTRFVQLPGREICQVVIAKQDQDHWLSGDDVDAYIEEDRRRTMGLGEPLSRTGLVRGGKSGKVFFIWSVHHALYDGWSLTLLLDMVQSHYERVSSPTPVPFQAFVKHLASIDDGLADAYWEREYEELETQIFPVLPSSAYIPRANQSLRHQVQPLRWSQTNFTASAAIHLAWGILAAKRSATSDAVFGALVSGRQAPVAGIERVLAPTIATVPVRIAVGWDQTVGAMMRRVQNQAADMVPFEQTGLQRIRRVSQGASLACRFQTLLVVHPVKLESEKSRLFAPRQDEVDEEAEAMVNFSTYALTVQCQLQERGMQILASFDSSVVQESVVSRLLQQFEHVLRQVLDTSMQATRVRDLSIASAEDLSDLWRWNASLPAPANGCIHDLIADMTRRQPRAAAIEAWDGALTYQQLDDLSDQLAHNIRELGVGPEVTVPLCFEKTMWMPVAMLGVLKAGGVFVPVDVGQAQDRARMVLAAIRPVVIVTSRRYQAFAQQEGFPTVQPQNLVTRGAQRPKRSSADVGLTPHSGAYIIFTSGSTGTPKGVVMEHGAASTSLVAHGAKLGLNQTTRFLQFASYTFDACIMEILTNLVYGGCICIPSDESRLERLAESMNEMRVSTMFATPSVARLIRPDEVPTLRTLAMGGEKVSTTDTARWAHLPRLLNVYGPTEWCAAWVVDPANPDSLVPIGAVGELLIQGNLLARGYLDDEARTRAAFMESPPWLTQHGRCGRLYKTGDLVRYNPDGTLVSVGRKDSQVKINGQRVELGEVEHHVRQLLTSPYPTYRGGVELAAEIIKPRDSSQQMLVVFICPDKASFPSADECAAQVRQMVAGLDERLTGVLPAHMIPGAYVALEGVPITATGKMDRRLLRAKGSSLTTSDLAAMSTQSTLPKRLPATQMQRMLAQIWARVLNITTEIGLDDNFFSLGGDSISAMQVSAAARSQGLHIPTRDLKLRRTIAKLADSLQVQPRENRQLIAGMTAESGGRFRLSPIQQYHFETRPEGPDWADLPFYLGITRRVPTQLVIDALHRLVGRHAMLRARFCPDETGAWVQYVCESTQDSLLFRHLDTTSLSQRAATIAECRASIDIENGPSLVAALFEDDGQQTLFLTAHHLVIDFVSWRLIFQDLEELLTGGGFASSPVTSFQEWCRLQRDYATENLVPEAALNHVPYQPPPNYWGTDDAVPGNEVYTRKHFLLDMPTSSAILGPCSARLHVRPHELMMGALSYSFSRVFQDRSVPPIFTEGHGREAWDETIDLSQTVGWFTTVFPVHIDASDDDGVLDFVFKTRESLLNTPRQGWSYFASKYLNGRGREAFSKDRMEINFNFLGQFQQLERESSLLQAVKLPENCRPPGMAPIDTVGVLDVVIFIERGKVCADLKYNSRVRHQDKIETWIQTFERTLVDIVRPALCARFIPPVKESGHKRP
ncbi:AMP-binding enzyme [Hirsutella rhossiliensis]|uniref:AMP-binding enzyme domain-containing protein n=1 Tax=Hirsutella rhossiliensis TaxID=111463 RepID=A0A9P8MQT8_9HYPO|nr:AMP-binding enzyme domain-containing protein [Hirsutella rhossiliensis]KAH0959550.1 AMP-binding enzyme domain-containing protein [Hirsutella rhossiliensis]